MAEKLNRDSLFDALVAKAHEAESLVDNYDGEDVAAFFGVTKGVLRSDGMKRYSSQALIAGDGDVLVALFADFIEQRPDIIDAAFLMLEMRAENRRRS